MLKNVAQLVHTRHRSVHNFLITCSRQWGVLLLPVQASSQLRLRGAELRRSTHHLAIAQISFSQKRIRRPRSWSPDTICASESRLFSPRLSRTRIIWYLYGCWLGLYKYRKSAWGGGCTDFGCILGGGYSSSGVILLLRRGWTVGRVLGGRLW